MEDGNVFGFSHLDEGVLVPPRKRLLAGFKKQNSSDQSCGSTSASPLPTGSETEVDNYAKTLLGSYSSGLSLEEIAESSEKAALVAAKVANTSRSVAEEKAVIAAKAIAAAKTALDLVAAFSEETLGRESHSKKNKSKKQNTMHSLYKKHAELENRVTDENQLRQLMHRTPGFSKHSTSSSDFKSLKQKRLKISPVTENTKVPRGVIFKRDSNSLALFNGDTKGSSHAVAIVDDRRGSHLAKLISSNSRMDNKNIVTQKRKARKQLVQMVERQVESS